MKVLVAGSTGFIGSTLVGALEERGDEVVRLVRSTNIAPNEVGWNPERDIIEVERLEGFDAVIHLGGVSIGERRWTERHKERLWNSRTVSTQLLARALATLDNKPKTFICASATGFYGDRGDETLTESSARGKGFLSDLCVNWELMTQPASNAGIRVAHLRSGIVLGHGGGVLKQQVPLFRLCLGGNLGSGKQFVSWIGLNDEISAILHVLDNENIAGPVNLTAPNPERNSVYTKILGHVLNRPTLIPVPRWMMTVPLGSDFTDEVLLTSQRVLPEVLQQSGFRFSSENLEEALYEALDIEQLERELKAEEKQQSKKPNKD